MLARRCVNPSGFCAVWNGTNHCRMRDMLPNTCLPLPAARAILSGVFAIALMVALPCWPHAQPYISGAVVDQRGEGVPFVHIIVNGQADRVFTTDIDGGFSLAYSPDIRRLDFSAVGFEVQRIELNGLPERPWRVVLMPASYTLQEAVVIAGENPAHRIIRLALKNRERHDPEKLSGYQYQAFVKMTLRMLPNHEEWARRQEQRKAFDKMPEEMDTTQAMRFDSLHLFLMETLSAHAYQRPQKRRAEVLRHRSSGFEEPWFVGVALQLQPFSFYRDELPFLEKRYLNPISPGSTGRYRFLLENTFYEGADSIFVISFQPSPNTAFVGLKGMLHIHSDGYAIQHLIAESAEEEQIRFRIEQKYSRVGEGRWFPAQLSLLVEAEKYPDPAFGTRFNARTWIDSVRIDPIFPRGFFSAKESYLTSPDINRPDSLLTLARREAISYTDSLTYAFWDSLGAAVKLDAKLRLLESVAEGALPLGKIDWIYADLLRFSEFEGFAPGLGLRTGRSLSTYFQLYGYAGYAIRAQQWKYAGQLTLFPKPANHSLSLGISYRNDLIEPAIFDLTLQNQLINRRFFAQRMGLQQSIEAFFAVQPTRSLQLRAALRQQQHRPQFEYQFMPPGGDLPLTEFAFAEAELYLRYAYGIQSFRFLGAETELRSDRPILHLRAAKGWDGWLGGEHDYLRLQSALEYTLRHHRWGALRLAAEAGWCSLEVPYAKLFTPIGTGAGWNALSLATAFEAMQPYEFVADRSLHLYVEHAFQRLARQSKFFQPQPSFIHRMGWGSLRNPEQHGPDAWRAMERGYWESGLALNSLLRFNYLNVGYIGLGVKALYRYGPYRLPRFEDNLAVRATVSFSR
jgi:hypothetical protein